MSRDVNSVGSARSVVGAYSSASLATADDDGIITSFATPTVDTTKSGAALNGALVSSGALSGTDARNATVTTGASVGTYRTGASYPIVVTGKHWLTGKAISESLLLTAANGGETITGKIMFKAGEALSVLFPGQVNGSGTFKLGCGTAKPLARGVDWFRCTTAGVVVCALAEDHTTPRPDGSALSTVSLNVQADTDYPYSVASIHEGTTAAFTCFSAGG